MQRHDSWDAVSFRPAKRQKSFHPSATASVEPHDPSADRYRQYETAWICALSIELAAARAVLDEIHDNLPRQPGDDNTYLLGSVGGHNVVVACLPATLYGTNNAANVLTNLIRSFPAVRHGLMVGIGGGVPSKGDIRLGDVVVGTRVMQDDLGKMVQDQRIQRTGSFKCPSLALATAVSTLRAKHEIEQSDIPSILQQNFQRLPDYRRPAASDTLFEASYHHTTPGWDCRQCNPLMQVPRQERTCTDPVVHYGGVASGNQVMRDGMTRDKIAQELNVHCFEMEAAGLMDILPCLPIRGICDYSDSHKNKEWQRYAAAVAASYACEFLSALPTSHTITRSPPSADSEDALQGDPRADKIVAEKSYLQSLWFPNINKRHQDLEQPADKTCSWVFEHQDFQDWYLGRNREQHQGLLCLKGNPGTGKSVLMKEAFRRAVADQAQLGHVAAAYFFDAKGTALERTLAGLFRSLLFQLLPKHQQCMRAFEELYEQSPSMSAGTQWGRLELQFFFHSIFTTRPSRRTIIFVDALDETNSLNKRELFLLWRDITCTAQENGVQLDVFLSSRHFPTITLNCPVIIMEENNSQDIAAYVEQRFMRSMANDEPAWPSLRDKILEKAAGVFLWVELVIDDVLAQWDDGKGVRYLLKQIDTVPKTLEKLFMQIFDDLSPEEEPIVHRLFQWAIFAVRPLRLHEWHHILAFIRRPVPASLAEWRASDYFTETDAQLEKLIRSMSRGLLQVSKPRANSTHAPQPDYETTPLAEFGSITAGAGSLNIEQGETRVIQVIHESVRQLFAGSAKARFAFLPPGQGHTSIMDTCLNYLEIKELNALVAARQHAMRRAVLSSETKSPAPETEQDFVHSLGALSRIRQTFTNVMAEHNYIKSNVFHLLQARSDSNSGVDIGRWIETSQSSIDVGATDERHQPPSSHASESMVSQVLEDYPALYSYATSELFTHAQSAWDEGENAYRVLSRLNDKQAWDRWKVLKEDVPEWMGFHDYIRAMGLKSMLPPPPLPPPPKNPTGLDGLLGYSDDVREVWGPEEAYERPQRNHRRSGSVTSLKRSSSVASFSSAGSHGGSGIEHSPRIDIPRRQPDDFIRPGNVSTFKPGFSATTPNLPENVSGLSGVYMCDCCPMRPKRFKTREALYEHEKNMNEAECYQNSVHKRRQSWSCSLLSSRSHVFDVSSGIANTCGYCGNDSASYDFIPFIPTMEQHPALMQHFLEVHKFGECNSSKRFYRADHFRQHLWHSHAITISNWANILETACMLREDPAPINQTSSTEKHVGNVSMLPSMRGSII